MLKIYPNSLGHDKINLYIYKLTSQLLERIGQEDITGFEKKGMDHSHNQNIAQHI